MYNKRTSGAVHGKDETPQQAAQGNTLSAEPSNKTLSSNASEQHHAGSVAPEVREDVASWRQRMYTEDDFADLNKLLEDEDLDYKPTAQQVESYKASILNKPVGSIGYYIRLGQEPPSDWVAYSLYNGVFQWMEKDP